MRSGRQGFWKGSKNYSPFILRRQLRESRFFQNCGTFCFDLYSKYHNFERNEIRATVFLKWTDFSNFLAFERTLDFFLNAGKFESFKAFKIDVQVLKSGLYYNYHCIFRIHDFNLLAQFINLFCVFPIFNWRGCDIVGLLQSMSYRKMYWNHYLG